MNHLEVTGGNAEVPVVANGILRRERHSWLEWFLDSFTPSKA
jgi:hypothetical protein